MNPIHFQGLNCYHDCVISMANYFKVDYFFAFATLWSETDFSYDPHREVYLTKRMLSNLEVMGAKIEKFTCLSEKEGAETFSLFYEGEFIIVGMDAFYILWNQFYQTFHGPHYFIVRNTKEEPLLCIDPTYNKNNGQFSRREIIVHAFEFIRLAWGVKKPLQIEPIQEAHEIINTHPNTRRILLAQIYDCVNAERERIVLLAKYIDSLIRNRYLYRFFLEKQPLFCTGNHLFLNNSFFSKWNTVKNGLYKASVSTNNEHILSAVSSHLNHLLDEEIAMAEKIIRGVSPSPFCLG